jgi:hypothetical protein
MASGQTGQIRRLRCRDQGYEMAVIQVNVSGKQLLRRWNVLQPVYDMELGTCFHIPLKCELPGMSCEECRRIGNARVIWREFGGRPVRLSQPTKHNTTLFMYASYASIHGPRLPGQRTVRSNLKFGMPQSCLAKVARFVTLHVMSCLLYYSCTIYPGRL